MSEVIQPITVLLLTVTLQAAGDFRTAVLPETQPREGCQDIGASGPLQAHLKLPMVPSARM